MKLKTKSILSLLIALAMCMSLCSMSAFAANTAKIGETEYATLADAIAAVPTDGTPTTIIMIADEAVDVAANAITVAKGKNIVLDLNGNTITGSCSSGTTSALIKNQGTLTIQDSSSGKSGKLIGGADPTWTWDGSDNYAGSYASNVIRNEGTLTVNGGTLYNASTGSAAYAIDNYDAGHVTINGGTIDAKKASAIRLFYNNGGSLDITGGVIGHYTSDSDCSFMGVQVMNDGANGVTVNLSGGEYYGSYAVYSDADSANSHIAISGGTYYSYVAMGSVVKSAEITGGYFNAWTGGWGNLKFIKGGKYIYEPDAEFIADGYYAKPLPADEAPYKFIVVPIPPIEITDSDAYILNDAGNLRFITNINDVSGTVSSYGSWVVDENYLNGGSIETKHAVLENAESIGANNTFVTDIMNIPQTMLGTTFYAKSFITVGGAPVWSEVYSTTVNDSDHNK